MDSQPQTTAPVEATALVEAVTPALPAAVEPPPPQTAAPVPVYEPLPRSQFELNAARMFGRFAILSGVLCVVGAGTGLAHVFETNSTLIMRLCMVTGIGGLVLIVVGATRLIAAAPDEGEAKTGFVAWGRLGTGIVLTLLGVSGRIVLRRFNALPPDVVVPFVMLQIIGPVLMAWASYATFILDSDQFDTGALLILIFLALEPVLFLI